MKIAIAMLLALTLSGCAWSDAPDEERGTLQFVNGVTTQSEVGVRLGQPNATTWLPDGTIVEIYRFAPTTNRPDIASRSKVLTLMFDSSGKLLNYSNTDM